MFRSLPSRVGRLFGALVVAAGPVMGAGLLNPVPSMAQGAAAAYRFDVRAGGPYRGTVGQPVSLQGQAVITGQQETLDDLRAIGRALLQYRADHGTYPPAALTDAAGRPLLSWRVLLLPELGQDALYRKFDLTKAWDDPVNRRLLSQIPAAYTAAGSGHRATDTAYAGSAGTKAVFRGGGAGLDQGIAARDIGDGPDMTIAAGPVGRSVRIPWSAPGDIDAIATGGFGKADGFDGPGAAAVTPMLFADGRVYSLPDSSSSGAISSWATIASGGCTPPTGASVDVGASWDLDGDGTFETPGATATFTPTQHGTTTVRFRGTSIDGRSIVRTARLVVR